MAEYGLQVRQWPTTGPVRLRRWWVEATTPYGTDVQVSYSADQWPAAMRYAAHLRRGLKEVPR